ncbi:O-antigen ligase family protein [Sphingomonas hankookensis]|uniref:O-antigen ligase-related domain-containing protein n=1 Tax=Sphingomonas hankookensis TaxID=563996 RepID=A0ABR5YBH9_9SPHN|nr:O-antigen ligase family protein [Sphingomonas hankookensis]KZE13276.1 hypothetical protein AVT10_03655 [Sphingomonas hankookensis]
MISRARPAAFPRPGIGFVLLAILLGFLWLAGGASRADALGQIVVRTVAWLSLIVLALFGPRPALRDVKPVALLLSAALLLVLVQLVPLPPAIWQSLPGRAMLSGATDIVGEAQPWRPWSMVPGATWNAAGSLIVPIAVLLLIAASSPQERKWLPSILLVFVTLSALTGLIQFSGASFNNPFVNDTPGQVSGNFANRNHLSLFLAIGCVLAPAWVFLDGRRPHWRGPVAIGLLLLFILTILATGSRAGMIVGMSGTLLGLLIANVPLRRELQRYPRWVLPVLLAGILVAIGGMVLLSVAADRAESINRAIVTEGDAEIRARALPVVLSMERTYWPAGTGFGSFDPVFRINEPLDLLKPTYFNHAHNDFLEIALDGGVAGLALMIAALLWWAGVSLRAWRQGKDMVRSRLGSAILLLTLIASAFDYPARTPMMMATIVVAAIWLAEVRKGSRSSALPNSDQQL